MLFVSLAATAGLAAQTTASSLLKPVAQVNRVAANADFSAHVQMQNQLPKWVAATSQTTSGVDLSEPMSVTIALQRSDAAEAAFEQMLSDQQNAASPLYHHWLTGNEIGKLYGPTDSDIAAVEAWAASEGLTVTSVASSRISIEVTGRMSAVASAFRTSFANFNQTNGATRLSAVSEPSIPAALSGVISHINGLTQTVHHTSLQSRLVQATSANTGSNTTVQPNLTSSSGSHYVTPSDFNTIYDIASVLSGGNTGSKIGSTTQRLAIIGRSRVATTDIQNFDNLTGLTYVAPNVILAGTDPGTTNDGNQDEATLDVNRVQGTATGVQTDLVIAKSTNTQDGVYIASNYVVNTLNASTLTDQIMSLSFGLCELEGGSSDTATYNNLFKTAAAEGVSVFVSSGDSGANGCYSAGQAAVNASASSNDLCGQYVTCVGGTQFVEGSGTSYWSSSNTSSLGSAQSYIPEGVWNEPTSTSNGKTSYVMAAGGGAPSIYLAKPSWQTGTGVSSSQLYRMTPDVSFTSAGHDGYLGCVAYAYPTYNICNASQGTYYYLIFSGTSAAAPSMAAISALLNTKMGSAQGLLNPMLYTVANGSYASTAVHDVTPTTSGVGSSCTVNTVSNCNNSTPSSSGLTVSATSGVVGYAVTTGYDMATGIGSLDVANFLTAAVATQTISTTLKVTAAPTSVALGSSTTVTATLTPSSTNSTAATGTVTFSATPSGSTTATTIGTASISSNAAKLVWTPTAAGTYTVTATYAGDSNYSTSTDSTGTQVVVANAFTITAAATSLPASGTLVSGTSVTDAITVTSVNSFAGTVALTCKVTAASTSTADTAAAAGAGCSLTPASAAITGSTTGASVLTITSTAGTSGSINVVVSGTSGTSTGSSPTITVKLTPPSFTVTSSPTSVTVISGTSGTSTLTLTSVNGFAGAVGSFSCTATNSSGTAAGTCSVSPSSVTLASGGTGVATVTVSPTAGTTGALNIALSATGTTTGASTSYTGTCLSAGNYCLTVTVSPTLTIAANPTSLAFTSGATSGNTSLITLQTATGVSGTASVSCTLSGSSPAYPPTCSLSSTSVTLASAGSGTTTLTIGSTTAVTAASKSLAGFSGWRVGALAFGLATLFAFRRRRSVASLAAFGLLLLGLTTMTGCGGDTAPKSTKSSSGSYTATVTATLNGQSVSTTVAVTIN
ncbi:protease pro-enzyme activation domain-containing protein [Granulicella cerasi]|nr:protease pro-enzyme activation domain-containing protein [Granulicella cerasi]